MLAPRKANYFVAANDRLPKSMYHVPPPTQPVIKRRDMPPRHGATTTGISRQSVYYRWPPEFGRLGSIIYRALIARQLWYGQKGKVIRQLGEANAEKANKIKNIPDIRGSPQTPERRPSGRGAIFIPVQWVLLFRSDMLLFLLPLLLIRLTISRLDWALLWESNFYFFVFSWVVVGVFLFWSLAEKFQWHIHAVRSINNYTTPLGAFSLYMTGILGGGNWDALSTVWFTIGGQEVKSTFCLRMPIDIRYIGRYSSPSNLDQPHLWFGNLNELKELW